MSTTTIKLSEKFPRPIGRFKSDGPQSGEHIRELLLPALTENHHLTVDLTGIRGCPSGPFEECFGGLIRVGGLSEKFLKSHLTITAPADLQQCVDRAWQYIADAESIAKTKKDAPSQEHT